MSRKLEIAVVFPMQHTLARHRLDAKIGRGDDRRPLLIVVQQSIQLLFIAHSTSTIQKVERDYIFYTSPLHTHKPQRFEITRKAFFSAKRLVCPCPALILSNHQRSTRIHSRRQCHLHPMHFSSQSTILNSKNKR
jgi:hypothetical protein